MSRRVSIVKSEIPGPYNVLDLPEGESIEFIATGFIKGTAVRQIIEMGRREEREGPIMRVFVDPSTPVFGAPYLDILAGRTVVMLETLFNSVGLPLKVKLTAHGKEPSKWYSTEYERVGGERQT